MADVADVASWLADLVIWHSDWAQTLLDIEAAAGQPKALTDKVHGIADVPDFLRREALAAEVLWLMDIPAPHDKAWCRLHMMAAT